MENNQNVGQHLATGSGERRIENVGRKNEHWDKKWEAGTCLLTRPVE